MCSWHLCSCLSPDNSPPCLGSCGCDDHLDQSNLGDRGFVLARISTCDSRLQGRCLAGLEAAGGVTFSRENNELICFCWGSAHDLFFNEPRASACELMPPAFRVGLLISINPSKNIPHRHAYRTAYSRQFLRDCTAT